MRAIAMGLLAFALAKIGLVQHLRLEGARDVIVSAYAGKAIAACEAVDPGLRFIDTRAADITMDIGDRQRPVALWQVDHADWPNRFRSVTLVLLSTTGSCRFDTLTGHAQRVGTTATGS